MMNDFIPNRGPVMAPRGIVAADHPLAAAAGSQALREGGTAIDAAIAAAAVMTVVQPHFSQLGGDLFLLAHDAASGETRAVNASGAGPASATAEQYRATGGIPRRGPLSVAGPGVVAGWGHAHARWGRLPWPHLFQPAIAYAREGFPVSTRLAMMLAGHADLLRESPDAAGQYLPGGALPTAGQRLRQPNLATTLETISAGGWRAFYEGDLPQRMAAAFQAAGGLLTEEDIAATVAEESAPPATEYHGYTIYEQPPVSQGFIVLEALNILERWPLATLDEPTRVHLGAEALKLAFEDRFACLGDPRFVDVPLERLISKAHAAERAAVINPDRARSFSPPETFPLPGDTTYLCAVDGEGNAVSLIQSVFSGFGSGFVAGNTGVLFNNRLTGFTLEPGHPNELTPGKRTVHTLNTYLATRDGRVAIVGGTPGADRQVQTNVQVLTGLIDLGLDPQTALDRARWSIGAGVTLELEDGFPVTTRESLAARGHQLTSLGPWAMAAGRAQLIQVLPQSGARLGASDLRGEGQPHGW